MKREIGRLHLQLPPVFADRAGRIGRLVGEALAVQQGLPAGRLAHLRVGPLRLDPSRSDRAVASAIAASIGGAIRTAATQSGFQER